MKNIRNELKKILNSNKKETIVPAVALLFIIVTVVGVTYAAFTYTGLGTKSNKVTTSTITMNYNEATNGITLNDAFPISDSDGKQLTGEGRTFSFTVTVTTGNNTAVGYEVSAVKDPTSTLGNNDVRIYLEKSTTGAEGTYSSVLEPTGFNPINATTEIGTPAGEMILHSDSTTSTRTDYYILRMWVAESYQVTGESKFFTIKVNVYGTDSHINTSGVTLNKNSMTLEEGESEQLSATVLPEYATDKSVTWTSSNTDVAVVDSSGNVTAQSISGTTATAVVTARDANGHSATCTVTVNKPDPTGVEIEDNITELNLTAPGQASGETTEGSSAILEAGTLPANANSNEVEWTTSDSDVLDIEKYTESNASGTGSSKSVIANKVKVTAKGAGSATLTVKSASNPNAPSKSITVTIQDPESTGLSIDKPNVTIDRNSNTTITATLNLSNSRDKTIYWSNSDSTKASISCSGGSTNSSGEIETTSASAVCTITGLVAGSTTITARDAKGHTATSVVTVQNELASAVNLSSDAEIEVGASHIFQTSVTPSDARNISSITWSSSNTNVATIPNNCAGSTTCEIEGLDEGTTNITVTIDSLSDTSQLDVIVSALPADEYLEDIADNNETMFYDGTTDNNLRYYGASPANYVTFNGETAGWRIIGVFDGKIKLIHSTKLNNTNYSWDNNGDSGINNWNRPAALRTMLNTGTYWNRTNGTCPYGNNNGTKACDFSDNSSTPGLNLQSKTMISESTWYLGAGTWDASTSHIPSWWYATERSSIATNSGGETTATANVGLMNLSDYGFASKNCYNTNMYLCNSSSSMDNCNNTNWLYLAKDEWTINPVANSTMAIWTIIDSGKLYVPWAVNNEGFTAGNGYYVRPSVYLKSSVNIVDGTGTSQDPYILDYINIKKSSISLSKDKTRTLTYETSNSGALTWKSSNSSIATVDSNGVVTGVHSGTAIITVRTPNGAKDTVEVTVDDTYQDDSGANPPELVGDMIPIVWDSSQTRWEKADLEDEWYDYDKMNWANAVTVSNSSRSTYKNADAGYPITESDVNAYWVWIPRYSYTLKGSYGHTLDATGSTPSQATPGAFDIKFESGTNSSNGSGTYSGDTPTNYYTPPGFSINYTKNGAETTGIWVAKFQMTNSVNEPQSKPGVASVRNQTVSAFYNGIKNNMNGSNNTTYGFKGNYSTHMSTNSEWSLMSYLSQSKYGKYGNTNYSGASKEIYQNKDSEYTTGKSNGTPSVSGNGNTSQINYTVFSGGTGASTTGTIYGIYDTSGGAWEYVMGGNAIGSTGFSSLPTSFMDYYTSYDRNTACNGTQCRGQNLNTTSGWYGDCSDMTISSYSWFVRGAMYHHSDAGIFGISFGTGQDASTATTRIVISPYD